MARHVIYIPGIGDHRSYGQNIVIQLWRLFGLRPHYMPLGWNKAEGFEAKQQRLLELIDSLHSKNNSVSLAGVSAGASASLNVFSVSNKITKVVCICGKINRPETIGKHLLRVNPDFGESMALLPAALERINPKKVLSIHPVKDQAVPIPDTYIKGAEEKTLPGWSHTSGIFFGITLGTWVISRFISRK